MRFFLLCVVIVFIAGCNVNKYKKQEKLVNLIFNESVSFEDCNIDATTKQHILEFFASYFTDEEIEDFITVTTNQEYIKLRQDLTKNYTLEKRKKLAEYISRNSKTDFFKKINSQDFKKEYSNHFNTLLKNILNKTNSENNE